MSKVFVVGAHLPNGGAYMLYHVGRIAARRVGLEPVTVRTRAPSAADTRFAYPEQFAEIAIGELLDVAGPDDLLVCSPAFSPHLLGLSFPGRSIMYVQGVNTYLTIDGFFDHYIAVSTFVQRHLALLYGWDVPVIPPFVHTERFAAPTPWADRPPGSVLVIAKALGDRLYERAMQIAADARPGAAMSFTLVERMPQAELLATMQRHRYYLTLSPLEGYSLTTVEAMLSGCCVAGFHGGGGLDFLRPGVNCDVVGYPRLDAAMERLARLVAEPLRAEALARQARVDGAALTHDAFEQRWRRFLDDNIVRGFAGGHVAVADTSPPVG
jgi:hypothetical protein